MLEKSRTKANNSFPHSKDSRVRSVILVFTQTLFRQIWSATDLISFSYNYLPIHPTKKKYSKIQNHYVFFILSLHLYAKILSKWKFLNSNRKLTASWISSRGLSGGLRTSRWGKKKLSCYKILQLVPEWRILSDTQCLEMETLFNQNQHPSFNLSPPFYPKLKNTLFPQYYYYFLWG